MNLEETPLYKVADRIDWVSEIFKDAYNVIKEVVWIGKYLATPFWWLWFRFQAAASLLKDANERIEGLKLDQFFENPYGWILRRLGASWTQTIIFRGHLVAFILYRAGVSMTNSLFFERDPIGFIRMKVKGEWKFLDRILEDAERWVLRQLNVPNTMIPIFRGHLLAFLLWKFGLSLSDSLMFERKPITFIRWKVSGEWKFLDDILADAERWILRRLGVPASMIPIFKDHLLAYLLWKFGLSLEDSLMFENNPAMFIRWKVRSEWPFLDDMRTDPIDWLMRQWMTALDRFLDQQVAWVIRTSERILNLIWQARL